MANKQPGADETAKNAFDFYNTYLSVIYGLLATQGLTSVVTFTSKDDEQAWNILSILLFAGTFIAAMRLWLSFANIDDLTRESYRVVARAKQPRFNFLLLLDTGFATTFAGLLLAMFSVIPTETQFFALFLWLAGLNLLYDLVSKFFFHFFVKQEEVIRRYQGKINGWIKQDVVVGCVAIALYLLDVEFQLGNSVMLASTFVVLIALQLIVGLFPQWDDAIRMLFGGSGADAQHPEAD